VSSTQPVWAPDRSVLVHAMSNGSRELFDSILVRHNSTECIHSIEYTDGEQIDDIDLKHGKNWWLLLLVTVGDRLESVIDVQECVAWVRGNVQ